MEILSSKEINEILLQAHAFYRKKDFASAAELYTKVEFAIRSVLEKNPGNRSRWFVLAEVLERTNRLEEAVLLYQKVFTATPHASSERISCALGRVLHKLKRDVEAIVPFKRALEINPLRYDVEENLAYIYFYQDQWEDAEKHYTAAILLKPDSTSLYFSLAVTLDKLGERTKSIAMLEKVIALDPNYENAYYTLGLYAMIDRNYSKALTAFRKLTTLNKHNAVYFYDLGRALSMLKKSKAAITAFENAILIDKNFSKAHYELAVLHNRQGRAVEVEKTAKKLTELGEIDLLKKLLNELERG